MSSLIYYFPIDLTGSTSTNRVNRESHLLVNHAGTSYRAFSLNHGGFYADSLIIEDSLYNQLTPNVDYVVDYTYQDTSDRTGLLVVGVITIINPAITGIVYATAQMVGGNLAFDLDASQVYIQHLVTNPGYVPTWGTYIGAERQWGPGELENQFWTESGFQDINIGLENLAQVIKAGDQTALMNYRTTAKQMYEDFVNTIGTALSVHESNTANPHAVTKTQVGLGNVGNYPVATEAQARAGTDDASYMTPLRTAQAIDTQVVQVLNTHIANTSNPHNTTAVQLDVPTQASANSSLNGKLGNTATAVNANLMSSPVLADELYTYVKGNVNQINLDPGIEWSSVNVANGSDIFWRATTYGNGLFVALGTVGGVDITMYSTDGINWTVNQGTANHTIQSVVYANGLFIAVGSSGNRAFSSTDGINWASRSAAAANQWLDVTFGNGTFVAVANSGTGNRVMTSTSGFVWFSRSAPDNAWYGVTYGNGLFVAVASSGTGNRVMTSPDGITWTLRTSAADNSWQSVAFGNGMFVAVSLDGTNRVMTSPDGITWTTRSAASANQWYSVTYGNGLFVAVGSSGGIMTSPDGITWTSRPAVGSDAWRSVTSGNGRFVAVASGGTDRVMLSPTNATWVDMSSGNSVIVAINDKLGSNNRVARSTDGQIWTYPTTPTVSNQWQSIAFGNGLFVAVAKGGSTNNRVYTSTDGNTWTQRTSVGDADWRVVKFGNGMFVAVGEGGSSNTNRIMTSTDGITWSLRTAPVTANWTALTFNPTTNRFVALPTGPSNTTIYGMYSNDNGVTWTSFPMYGGEWVDVVYGNNIFTAIRAETAGATGQQVARSTDGINWYMSSTPYQDAQAWKSLAFGDGYFFAVCDNDTRFSLMTSYNGINWVLRTPPKAPYSVIAYVGFLGRFVAIGGDKSFYLNHNLNQGEGTTMDMTYTQVYTRIRTNLPTSLLNKQALPYNRLASGSTNASRLLGRSSSSANAAWRTASYFISRSGIVTSGHVHFMDYAGDINNAVATISAIYADTYKYPSGTVVLFRITATDQIVARRVMRAAIRSSSSWSLI